MPETVHPHADPISGIPVDSPLFRQRAQRVVLTGDPDRDTEITAQEMCREIQEAAKDPLVQSIARNAALRIRGGPMWLGSGADPMSPRVLAESMFWWCKHYLRFKHHSDMFEAWSAQLGDPSTKLQLLIAPDVLVRMRKMEGDCAIYTMMVCALLEALGQQWQVCPCAVNHATPRIFSHVFARAVMPDGQAESLDASHGKYPGWQVPKQDMLRLWVFDRDGRHIASQDSPGFSGLHDYRRTRFRRGLGQDGLDISEGGTYQPPPGGGETFGSFPEIPPPDWWSASGAMSPGSMTAPSQNSAQWASFASNLAKMGFTLAQINSIQPGTVVSANGAILRQNPGYSVPVGTAASLNLGSSGNVLLYGALGLGALFVVGKMMGGR